MGPPSQLFWLLVCARRACNSPNSYALPRGGCAGCGRDICLIDQSNRSNIFSTVFCDLLSSCNRLLHSVVNNSCGFHPQWKVVALIFSAARLPRLLEDVGSLRQVCQLSLRCPFFRTQTPTCLQSWLHFRTPGRAPNPCPSFQDSVPIGEFGAQILNPTSPEPSPPPRAIWRTIYLVPVFTTQTRCIDICILELARMHEHAANKKNNQTTSLLNRLPKATGLRWP